MNKTLRLILKPIDITIVVVGLILFTIIIAVFLAVNSTAPQSK